MYPASTADTKEPLMEMSYAQAINEAKQVIVQQSNRIKTDADKIRQQQQTIVDQCSVIATHESKVREQATEINSYTSKIESLEAQVAQLSTAREQAEAVVDRQGQRLSSLQSQIIELEKKTTDQSEIIGRITSERDNLRAQLPTQEDNEALASIVSLLTTKKASSIQNQSSMRFDSGPISQAA
jgi:chromosome segregation ATPase